MIFIVLATKETEIDDLLENITGEDGEHCEWLNASVCWEDASQTFNVPFPDPVAHAYKKSPSNGLAQ